MAQHKSPRFPNASLGKAIDYIRKIHNAERTNPMSRDAIAKHMGYKGISGASSAHIGTLSQYGLIERASAGEMRVSQLSVNLIHPENDAQKQKAINAAANNPSLFSELNSYYDNPPTDETLNTYLKRKNFSDRAVKLIIDAYLPTREMIKNLDTNQTDTLEEPTADEVIDSGQDQPNNLQDAPSAARHTPNQAAHDNSEWFRVKVGTDKLITINFYGEGEIGPKEIQKIITILEAQKGALED